MDDGTIQFYLSAKVVSEKVKAALAEIVKRKSQSQQVAADRTAGGSVPRAAAG
jgi:hypothetical protein